MQYLSAINQQELKMSNEQNGQLLRTHAQSDWNPPTYISYTYSSTQAGETGLYLNMASVDNRHHMEAQVARNILNIFRQIGRLNNLTREQHWQYLQFLLERIQRYYEVLTSRYQEVLSTQNQQNLYDSNFQVRRNGQDQNMQSGYNWKNPETQTANNQQQSNIQNGKIGLHLNNQMERIQQSSIPERNVQNGPSSHSCNFQNPENHPTSRRANPRHQRGHPTEIRQDLNSQTVNNWRHPQAQIATSQQELNTQISQAHQHSNTEMDWQTSDIPLGTQSNHHSNILSGQIRQDQNSQTVNNWRHPEAQTATSQQELNTQIRQVHQHSNTEMDWQTSYIPQGIQTPAAINVQESTNLNRQVPQYSTYQMEPIRRPFRQLDTPSTS